MPRLEPKQIQKELETELVWPVYWLTGTERMKSQELYKRIRKCVLGSTGGSDGDGSSPISAFDFSEDRLDGATTSTEEVIQSAQSPSLLGGVKLVSIRDAHLLKDSEKLTELLGDSKKPQKKSDTPYVIVAFAKDLDGRKKFSKTLVEKAAVVSCEAVAEADRSAWIQYLVKRRGMTVSAESIQMLALIEPWSLDTVDLELEKLSLNPESSIAGISTSGVESNGFLDVFFKKESAQALAMVSEIANKPEVSLPLLGLLGWQVRQLIVQKSQQKSRGGRAHSPMSPYQAQKMRAWIDLWSLSELKDLSQALGEVDFALKQRPLLPLGVWSRLVQRFLKK